MARVVLPLRRTWTGRRPVTLYQVRRLVEEVCRVLTGRPARPIAGAGPRRYAVGTWDASLGARAVQSRQRPEGLEGGTSHRRRRRHRSR